MKKKVKMCCNVQKNFQQGYEEYVLDMKARNLRDGTIRHYEQSIKQIYKRIPPDTPIESFDEKTVPNFIIQLREDPKLNEVSLGTYSRDLKTLLRFFMKCKYLPHFEIAIPKTDKTPIETYTDEELKALIVKPDLRACTFPHYRGWVMYKSLSLS